METRPHRLKDIVGRVTEGRRVYIVLSCGHRVLHNPRVEMPKRKWCGECEPS